MLAQGPSIGCGLSPPSRWSRTKRRRTVCLPRNAPCGIAASNFWPFIIRIPDQTTHNHPKRTCGLPTIHRRFTLFSDSAPKSPARARFAFWDAKDVGGGARTKLWPNPNRGLNKQGSREHLVIETKRNKY